MGGNERAESRGNNPRAAFGVGDEAGPGGAHVRLDGVGVGAALGQVP